MFPRSIVLCALLLAPSLPSVASTDVVHFGHNIVLTPNQQFHNASCVLCSVLVSGRGSGSVRVFAGNVLVEGSVTGPILVLGGNVALTGNAHTGGRIIVIGGRLQADAALANIRQTVLPPIIFLPLILTVCVLTACLVTLVRRLAQGTAAYPPLPGL